VTGPHLESQSILVGTCKLAKGYIRVHTPLSESRLRDTRHVAESHEQMLSE